MELIDKLKEEFKQWPNKFYLVGGSIRDLLQGKESEDIDLVAQIPAEELLAIGCKFIDPTSAYPVFILKHETLGKIDIALPRIEKKIGPGHKGFKTFSNHRLSIEKDLERRDFTINSMALRLTDSKLYDPFNGVNDLKRFVLLHTNEEAFVEDPLRVFRAYRFCTYGFVIDDSTKYLITNMKVNDLIPERVFTELIKAMEKEHPSRFFESLIELGTGKEFFDPIFKMQDIPAGPFEFHPERDVLVHSIQALNKISKLTKDPYIRLSVFLHDLGKIKTSPDEWPAHHEHEKVGVEILEKLLNDLKAPTKLIDMAKGVMRHHMRAPKMSTREMKPSKWVKLAKEAMDRGFDDALVLTCLVDGNINIKKEMELAKRVNKMNVWELGLTPEFFVDRSGKAIGETVLQKRIGKLKHLLREEGVICSDTNASPAD